MSTSEILNWAHKCLFCSQ